MGVDSSIDQSFNNNIFLVSNTMQIGNRKITTWIINFDKNQGDTFIYLTAKWQ